MKKIILLAMLVVSALSYGQYCTISASNVEPITVVDFAGIQNTTSAATSSPSYEDFTTMVGNVFAGDSHVISLQGNTNGSFTCYFTVFFDWNQNGVLDDPGEAYTVGAISGSTGTDGQTASASIAVPATAMTGNTRMRVIKNFSSPRMDPCGSFTYGQIEDYTINVAIPACPSPYGLTASNITLTSADMSWTAGGTESSWKFSWGALGYSPGDTNEISAVTTIATNYQITGLTSNTTYHAYVQADCGGGSLSSWHGPYAIVTPCASVSALPYLENFDTYGTGASAFPPCWERPIIYNSTWPSIVSGSSVSVSSPNSLKFQSDPTIPTYAVSPPFADNIRNLRVSFMLRREGNSSGTIDVGVMSNATDPTTFELVQTISPTDNVFHNYTFNLNNVTLSGPGNFVALRHNSASGVWYYWLDDFKVENIPTCPDPTLLTSPSQGATTADLAWTVGGSETSWNVVWGMPGFTPGDANQLGTAAAPTNPFQITGLTPNTTYDAYVQADCGGGDLSPWTGPVNFTTACVVAIAPWIYDVESQSGTTENSLVDDCWSATPTTGFAWNVTGMGTTVSSSTGPDFANSGSKYFFTEATNGSAGNVAELESPLIDVSALTTPALTFYYHMYGATMGTLEVLVFDGTTWNSVWTKSGEQHASGSDPWTQELIPLTGYTGIIQVKFKGVKGSSYTGDMAVDDISIIESPTCFQPENILNTNVTASTADFTWDNPMVVPSNGFQYVVMDVGQNPDVATAVSTGASPINSVTVTGLTPLTQGEFYVRSDCGAGDYSGWEGPFAFVTGCTAPLSGNYTIGGATPDFSTLTEAVAGLNICGISGPVVFNVVAGSGPYNEQLTINEVIGASATNTITFNGNGATVTASTTTSSRSIFLLDGTDYVTINDFNLVTQEPENNFVIQLTNGADYNTISNNTIDLSTTMGSSSSSNAGIVMSASLTSATSAGDNGSNLTISNNTIIGGYYGIVLNGESSSINSTNNNVVGNTVQDFYYYGIYMKSTSGGAVNDNDIHRMNRGYVSSMYGIYYLTSGDDNMTIGNKIHDSHTADPMGSNTVYAIYHTANDASASTPHIVANNAIYNLNGDSGTLYAIYNSSSDNVKYYHNTISLDHAVATGGIARGFYQTSAATGIEFMNNIISITRGGTGNKHALYFNTATSSITSDFNDLYVNSSGGTNGVGYKGSNQVTLADWQTASSGDMNSLDLDPQFAAAEYGDLNPTNVAVDNMGTPIAGITTDIDGNPRSATTPDMGAYEFSVPTCIQPNQLVANNVTINSLDLSWNERGTATTWEIEYGLKGFAQGTGTTIIDNDGTIGESFTGLMDQTEYDFYVRSICSPTDSSNWTGPLVVKTKCAPVLAPFFDDVESHSLATSWVESQCWTTDSDSAYNWNIGTGTTPSLNTGPTGAYSGNNYFFVEASNGATGDEARLYTPKIDLSEMATANLSFYYHMYGADINALYIDVYDGTTWTNNVDAITGQQQTSSADPWLQRTVSLASYTGIIQIRFRAKRGSSFEGDISLDDIAVNGTLLPCADPSAIVISNISQTTADISWTENGTATQWELEYGPAGFTPGNGTLVSDNDGILGETISGLTNNTSYDVYVRAICSSIRSSGWVGPTSFTTLEPPCIDPTAIVVSNITHNSASVSWTENGFATQWEIEYGPVGFTQGSGTVVADNDGTLGETLSGLSALTNYDVYVRSICSATNSSAWVGPKAFTTLVAPCVDPSGITVTNITHNSAQVSWTENGTATQWEIEYGIAGFTQGSGTLVVDNDGTLGENLSGLTASTNYEVYVRSVCSSTNKSAWIGPKAFTTLVAPCVDPSAIVVSNVTDTSADVSWTENGTATQWEIEYGLTGFSQGSGTVVNDNDGTLGETLSGLTQNTAYDVYVRAVCSASNKSAWIGPKAFTTLVTPCADPSAIVISNITNTTAEVSWTENGTATEWEIEYGLAGFAQGSGTIILDSDGTLGETLTGLTKDTNYDVYVRAICSATNMSAWIGPETFKTDDQVGIDENVFNGFNYYPNPMAEVINISSHNEMFDITIYNLIGQQVLTYKMEANTATLDVSSLSSGTYMMQVVSKTGRTVYYKLIKE